VRPDGTLVSYYSEGATFDRLDYYEVFAAGENGTLHREFALKHVYNSFEYDEGDGSPIVEEWYGRNKERITKKEYEAQLNTCNKAIYNRIDSLHGNKILVLEYLLNGQYDRFCCTLYIPEGSSFRSSVVMHVLADDVEIYVSPEMTAASEPVKVDIDLSGCVNLKITFSAGSWYNSVSDATLCLADPYLYLAGDR